VLVWSPGKGSPVHDHADAHCLMKVLKGTLKETVYHEGRVTYMADELGLHKISNPDPTNVAVSLHRQCSVLLIGTETDSEI